MSDNCLIEIDVWENKVEFSTTKIRKARVPHKCGECHEEITPGELYEFVSGKHEGEFVKIETCLICVEIREELFCSYYYEEIWDDIRNSEIDVDMAFLDKFSPPAQRKLIEKVVLEDWRFDDEEAA